MPVPTGSQAHKCSMQRALFASDPTYAKKWVDEYGDQCSGIKMKTTKKMAKNGRKK